MPLILASASPRRQELLRLITDDFTVCPAGIDEILPVSLSPRLAAEHLAREKARAVSAEHPGAIVLGADTTVLLGDSILGKPDSPQDAVTMLQMLSGNTHTVITGVALVQGDRIVSFREETKVTFYPLTKQEILDYVRTGEPLDKAGSYGIQGYGALLIKQIEGDYYNVVGLPVARTKRTLDAWDWQQKETDPAKDSPSDTPSVDTSAFQEAVQYLTGKLVQDLQPMQHTGLVLKFNPFLKVLENLLFQQYRGDSPACQTILPEILEEYADSDAPGVEQITPDRVTQWNADLSANAFFYRLENDSDAPRQYILIWQENRYDFSIYQKGDTIYPGNTLIPQFGSSPVTQEKAAAALVGLLALLQTSEDDMAHASQRAGYIQSMFLEQKPYTPVLSPVWKDAEQLAASTPLQLYHRTRTEQISQRLLEDANLPDRFGTKILTPLDVRSWVASPEHHLYFLEQVGGFLQNKGEYWNKKRRFVLLWRGQKFFFTFLSGSCSTRQNHPINALIPQFGNQSIHGQMDASDAEAVMLGLRAMCLLSDFHGIQAEEAGAYIRTIQRRQSLE